MLIRILLIICLLAPATFAGPGEVIFGQSASFSGGAWEPGLQFNSGLLSAFHEVNTNEGGVNGRIIKLISFDDQYDVEQIAPNVAKLLAIPDMFCFVAFMGSPTTAAALPLVDAAKMPIIGPVTGSAGFRKTFNPWTIHVRAGYDDEALTMLRLFVTELQYRRISIIYQDDLFGEPAKNIMVTALAAMKLEATSIHSYERQKIAEYDYAAYAQEVWSNRPQGVILYTIEGFSNAFMTEFFKLQTYPVSFVTGSWMGDMKLRFLRSQNLNASNFYQTQVVPHPSQSQLNITRRYRAAIIANGGSAEQFDFLSLEGYIVGRIVVEALRRTSETNNGTLDRAEFLKAIYTTKIFSVDELLAGPYSNDCVHDPGTANGRSSMCYCNQGLRSVSTTRATENYEFSPAGFKDMVYPITECYATVDVVSRPVLFSILRPQIDGDLLIDGFVAKLSNGLTLDVHRDPLVAKDLRVAATNPNNNKANATVEALLEFGDEHLLLGGIAGMNVGTQDQYPVFPVFGTTMLQGTFHRQTIHLHATIQQQIHVASSHIASNSSKPVYVLLSEGADDEANSEGETVRTAMTGAFDVHGITDVQFITFAAVDLGAALRNVPALVNLIIGGLATPALFNEFLDFMDAESGVDAFLAYEEMMVHNEQLEARYPTANGANATSNDVPRRLYFSSNFPLWTGTGKVARAYQKLMKEANLESHISNPQYFTGYFISRVVQFVLLRADEVSPAAFVSELYRTSIVAFDDVALGPFVDTQCSNEDCLCNIGARVVDLRTVSGFRYAEQPLLTTRFAKCRVPTADDGGSQDNAKKHLMIILASVLPAATVLAIALVIYFKFIVVSGAKDNRHAPKDSDEYTIVFTDVESSTALWARGPHAMGPALDLHNEIIRTAITKNKCYEVKTIGDAFMVACTTPVHALKFSLDVQNGLFNATWSEEVNELYQELYEEWAEAEAQGSALLSVSVSKDETPETAHAKFIKNAVHVSTNRVLWNGLRVRIGIATGEAAAKLDPVSGGYDYFGSTVNLASRIEASGHGGQIIFDSTLLANLQGNATLNGIASYSAIGDVHLKGFTDSVHLTQALPAVISEREFPPPRGGGRPELDVKDDTSCVPPALRNASMEGDDVLMMASRSPTPPTRFPLLSRHPSHHLSVGEESDEVASESGDGAGSPRMHSNEEHGAMASFGSGAMEIISTGTADSSRSPANGNQHLVAPFDDEASVLEVAMEPLSDERKLSMLKHLCKAWRIPFNNSSRSDAIMALTMRVLAVAEEKRRTAIRRNTHNVGNPFKSSVGSIPFKGSHSGGGVLERNLSFVQANAISFKSIMVQHAKEADRKTASASPDVNQKACGGIIPELMSVESVGDAAANPLHWNGASHKDELCAEVPDQLASRDTVCMRTDGRALSQD